MTRSKKPMAAKPGRRRFTDEFKDEAVQMLLDGHTPTAVAERLGLGGMPKHSISTAQSGLNADVQPEIVIRNNSP